MPKITDTGVIVITQDEYLEKIKNNHLAIDPDWVTDANSPDGQKMIMDSRMLWELDQEAVAVRASIDPRQAKNSQVDDLAALFNVYRDQQRQSVITFDTVGTAGTVIKAGSQIINEQTGDLWTLDAETIIPAPGTFTAVEYGLITDTGTFKPNTLVTGWEGVTNPTNFQIGREDQTDEQLEQERVNQIERSANGVRGAVKAAILNVDGVNSCQVKENDEQYEVDGQPGNSLHCIVSGGDEVEICQAIDSRMSVGCKLIGAIEHPIKADENDLFPKTIRFDRPTFINMWVRYTINGFDELEKSDIDNIPIYVEMYANGASDAPYNSNKKGFEIGQSPSSDLFTTPLNWAIGESIAENSNIYTEIIEFSSDGATWVAKQYPIGAFEQAVFSAERVITQGVEA